MRKMRSGLAIAATLLLGCAGGTAAESHERGELEDLQREIAASRDAALTATNQSEQERWLEVYDEKTNALNELYEKRSRRLDTEAGAGTPTRRREAATCKSAIVDGEIETSCR